MLSLLEFLLTVAVVVVVGVQALVTYWKLKLVTKRAIRKVTENKIIAFAVKIGMFLYFSLVVSTVDRAINN